MNWTEISIFIGKLLGIYLVALFIVRLIGKRALGELCLFDLVIMAGIGDAIVVVGLEQQVSFLKGVVILVLLGGMEMLFAMFSYHFRFFARIMEGKPTLLIRNGVVLERNLAREHLSHADLRQELRKQGVSNINAVSRAVLESCGQISIILAEEETVNEKLYAEITALRAELQELKAGVLDQKEN